jgi:hypothetical protein
MILKAIRNDFLLPWERSGTRYARYLDQNRVSTPCDDGETIEPQSRERMQKGVRRNTSKQVTSLTSYNSQIIKSRGTKKYPTFPFCPALTSKKRWSWRPEKQRSAPLLATQTWNIDIKIYAHWSLGLIDDRPLTLSVSTTLMVLNAGWLTTRKTTADGAETVKSGAFVRTTENPSMQHSCRSYAHMGLCLCGCCKLRLIKILIMASIGMRTLIQLIGSAPIHPFYN